ncbi:MAG: Na+:solute symporter [Candidatus Omnitrophica bacterium]|nr:Na+:solute symporter [Candidatus Omnitrophota bacterium]
MTWLDWSVVAVFGALSLAIGLAKSREAGQSLEAYFVSNRALGWWLAGTSMAATAFSSDTPLLVTGMVRRRGVWGVWEVWALGLSTMLAVFVFSKLWKRANVTTEVELVELRYSGRPAAFLRGFKAVYWGLLYNCYIIGVWPVTGMTKILQETTGLGREWAIVACIVLGTAYTAVSGLWGVVLTDAFQFVWAMAGAAILAGYAVWAVGGLQAVIQQLEPSTLAVIPPAFARPDVNPLESPFGWFLGLMAVQWWAWKNTDGGGIIVQRLVSCKDEQQAMRSVLWFNVAHYCLRSWPWVITAVVSMVLIPDHALLTPMGDGVFVDHERAYPRLITMLLPVGLRGVLLASLFAAFVSTLSTQLNWGASYLVNDGYRRFVNPRASERHYLRIAKLCTWLLAGGAMWVAWGTRSIGSSFTWILHLTAGIGPVYLLRWLWWRINPWSEIAAMTASLPVYYLRPHALGWLGLPNGLLVELLFMVGATAAVWVPATLATAPVSQGVLKHFYSTVRPPGWWARVGGGSRESLVQWIPALLQWAIASFALLATTIGPIRMLLTPGHDGWMLSLAGVLAWSLVLTELRRRPASP